MEVLLPFLIVCLLVAAGCTSTTSISRSFRPVGRHHAAHAGSILVYAGAGLKAPLDEIGPLFTEQYGIAVQYSYWRARGTCPPDEPHKKRRRLHAGFHYGIQNGKKQGLVNESKLVAYHVPVIVVQKGNPKNITTLADFARAGLKVALGDANATAIGKAACKDVCSAQHQCTPLKRMLSHAPRPSTNSP